MVVNLCLFSSRKPTDLIELLASYSCVYLLRLDHSRSLLYLGKYDFLIQHVQVLFDKTGEIRLRGYQNEIHDIFNYCRNMLLTKRPERKVINFK